MKITDNQGLYILNILNTDGDVIESMRIVKL